MTETTLTVGEPAKVTLEPAEQTAVAFIRDKGPCGHDLLHVGAWLRDLLCTRGCQLPAGWTA